MKKIIFTSYVAIAFFVIFSTTALTWDDCPLGKTDDAYPGDCNKYIDTDKDGICDYSQPAPEDRNKTEIKAITEEETHDLISGQDLKTKTVSEVAQIYQINAAEYALALSKYYKTDIKPADSFQFLQSNYGVKPSVAKDIAESVKTKKPLTKPEFNDDKNKKVYDLMPIVVFLTFLYVISYVLSKKNIMSVSNHKKIWNVLLLLTFLASGILGILLVIRINFGVIIPLPFNILFWHVETGIAMATISVFHVLWHWTYFKNLFMIKK